VVARGSPDDAPSLHGKTVLCPSPRSTEYFAAVAVDSLPVVVDDLRTPGIDALTTKRVGGHADDIETSIILALKPWLVHMDRAVRDERGVGS
jgi:hypothetical protein